MSFVREVIRDKPIALYMMDDTSPFQDYSGYNRTASSAGGTPPQHISLVAGAKFSQVFGNSITGTFAAPVFYQGLEEYSFTLEAWVRAISVDGTSAEQQVLGNLNQMDGLTINGNKVSFVIKFTTAPEARVTFDIQQGRAVHLVGVKVRDKISLFVNGELAGEHTLTEEQQASLYSGTNQNLYSGAISGTQKIAVNGLAAYAAALDQTAISRHFLAGSTLPDGADVAQSFRGEKIPVSLANANVFLDQWWTTEQDWNAAQLFNVAVVDGQLQPQFDASGNALAGRWLDSFALSAAEGTSVYGVSFNWDGEGITIEVSLDGIAWEAVQRGVNIELVPAGFDPTNKELQIRVSFADGVNGAFLDNLNAVGIKAATTPPVAGRVVTFASAYPEREYRPLELHDNWGAEIGAGGTITISGDTSEEAVPARTLELWIKRTSSATNPTVNITGQRYLNAVAAPATLTTGEWTLMHIVSTTDITGSITITGPAQVGQAVIYDTALTAAQIAAIHAQYTLSNPLQVLDNSVLTVTESAAPLKVYAHDWSIQGAG